jgi:hypothetical protein
MDREVKIILEDLIKMVRHENKDLFTIFEDLFQSFKEDLTHLGGKPGSIY